ncbi:MAG: 16S rRNA (cytosine(1402)-N(4))-methyltransferase RsmH [Bacteroidetes bacterium]|nr:16S rRNA (cytosine(1402)-N(4))-methyltransferase RsmH [Bacteroidota bacterium]
MLSLMYHIPVLLHAAVAGLALPEDGRCVDATFGGGGHSRHILEQLGAQGRLYAFDQDPDARCNALADARFSLIPANFRHLQQQLAASDITQVDAVLADLGVSSYQLDEPRRGFSYRAEAPLDMRMDTTTGITAAEFLNERSAEEIARILWQYGEFHNSRRMAAAIVGARPLQTTTQLIDALHAFLPRVNEYPVLSRIFQALRIAVNDEMGALEDLLTQSLAVLKPGGRLVIISYHSLEDRMVKHFMQTGNFEGTLHKDFYGNPLTPWKLITRKAVQADEQEIAHNPRARSARLRIAQKI